MGTITITEVGTIGTYTNSFNGIDSIGIFGPAGASLVGQHFSVVFTGSDCTCSGGIAGGVPGGTPIGIGVSPVQDATLTINGITYHSGPGYFGDMNLGLFQTSQVNFANGVISISGGGLGMGTGGFRISAGPESAGAITSGFFIGEYISNSLNVPGPIVGAELPGLLALIIFGGFCWRRALAPNRTGGVAEGRTKLST